VSAILKNGEKQPLAMVSGGVNRIVGIMIAMASRKRSVVIVDEIENGIYFAHQRALWKSLLFLSKRYSCQLFLSSHSYEWMKALVDVSGDQISDVCLWRLQRDDEYKPELFRFSGNTLKSGIEFGVEVRGG